MHAPLQRAEARLALGVEGDDLAVEHRAVVAQRAVEAADLGIARGDVEQVARVQAHAARLGVADRAHAVPLDLEGPVARRRAAACRVRAIIGTIFSGMGSPAAASAGGSMRWIIQFLGSSSLSIGNSA